MTHVRRTAASTLKRSGGCFLRFGFSEESPKESPTHILVLSLTYLLSPLHTSYVALVGSAMEVFDSVEAEGLEIPQVSYDQALNLLAVSVSRSSSSTFPVALARSVRYS